jgi:hypothetical protein
MFVCTNYPNRFVEVIASDLRLDQIGLCPVVAGQSGHPRQVEASESMTCIR